MAFDKSDRPNPHGGDKAPPANFDRAGNPRPADASGRPPQRPHRALGMPNGSIRAALTLLTVGVVVVQAAQGAEVSLLWSETLMIALAHYFTSRRLLDLPPEIVDRLAAEGIVVRDQQPLYLPRNSIRLIIVGAFLGLAWLLYQQGRLWSAESAQVLGTVGAYLLGIVLSGALKWFNRLRGGATPGWWIDLKALAALGLMGYVTLCTVGGRPDLLIPSAEHAALGVMLFYFGSR